MPATYPLRLIASEKRPARSVVDPEALILASLWLQRYESRLGKLNRMFARLGSQLVSTQRIKNLKRAYREDSVSELHTFALLALKSGNDPKWRSLAEGGAEPNRKGVKSEESFMVHRYPPAALMLRLRLAFSVGIKADALSFLIGRIGIPASVQGVTVAIGYQGRSVRRALEELAAADLIEPVNSAPVSYLADEKRWDLFLELDGAAPGWWYWHQLYAFGADLDNVAEETAHMSPYLQSSKARDLLEKHTKLFAHFPQLMTDPVKFPGEAYLERFALDVASLAERIVKNWV
jgi:hypothetical protein